MRIKAVQITQGEWKFYELGDDGVITRELTNVRGGTIGMGFLEKSEITLHLDIDVQTAFGQAVVMCKGKDDILRQVKKIEFIDGTIDEYA